MELVAEVKTLSVYIKCDKCGNGIMERNGDIVLTKYPLQYPHKCNNCGYKENYSISYPYQKFVPIEEPREPVESEGG